MIVRYLRIATSLVLCAITGTVAPAAGQMTFRVIAQLNRIGQPSVLSEGSPGVFYSVGGNPPPSAFSITSQGAITTLVTFTTNGYNIESQLVSAPNNRFYSVAEIRSDPPNVFSVSPSPGRDIYPAQSISPFLTQNLPDEALLGIGGDATGALYLAKCALNGTVTSLYQFPSGEFLPNTAVYAMDGNYYGVAVTAQGSDYLYRVTPSGSETTLYNFSPANSFGPAPSNVPLLQSSDGNLYGATFLGGANGTGSIYKFTLGGQYSLIYSFPKSYSNSGPQTMIEGSDGNLYGAAGGSRIFRLTKSGQYTLLYTLSAYPEGGGPLRLTQGSDGNLYGTAATGGAYGGGTVFVLDAGLPKPTPWVRQFNPRSGPAGTQVLIWGSNLLSASVEFNGVPASEVSNSGSNYVLATVPAGATSGPVTVTTPGGTSASKAHFTVQ